MGYVSFFSKKYHRDKGTVLLSPGIKTGDGSVS